MPEDLTGKVAFVSGGNSGVGRAAAEQLCRRGARVVVTGRDRRRGAETEQALTRAGGDARFIEMEAASEESIRSAVGAAVRQFGGLDFLVNNAAYEGPVGPILDLSEQACDEVLATNVKGPMMAARHAIPRMLERGGGCIVNVASFLGTIPFPDNPAYGASKAALIHFTRSLAAGYGAQGIRCYAVCPYITDTPMIERVTGGNADVRRQLASLNPSGRIASPGDIAGAIVKLLSGEVLVDEGGAVLVDAGGATASAGR
ncbi:MAG TPA: SDR family oxidoreductase [Vicinamibacterales bacterium]|nr:SDR family oxidoreductase [Vicinamibacterales bacterium]